MLSRKRRVTSLAFPKSRCSVETHCKRSVTLSRHCQKPLHSLLRTMHSVGLKTWVVARLPIRSDKSASWAMILGTSIQRLVVSESVNHVIGTNCQLCLEYVSSRSLPRLLLDSINCCNLINIAHRYQQGFTDLMAASVTELKGIRALSKTHWHLVHSMARKVCDHRVTVDQRTLAPQHLDGRSCSRDSAQWQVA